MAFTVPALLLGCSDGSVKFEGPGMQVTGNKFEAEWGSSAKSVSVMVFQLKDAQGGNVGDPIIGNPQSGTFDVPASAEGLDCDYKVVDVENPTSPPGGLLAPPSVKNGVGIDYGTLAYSTYPAGCVSLRYHPAHTQIAYMLRARAKTSSRANSLMETVLTGGVGTRVPAAVSVDSFVEMQTIGETVSITSSLPVAFTDYTIAIDGVVVSDVEIDLNATTVMGANGWRTITSILPLDLVLSGSDLMVSQRGSGASGPSVIEIALQQ